MDEKLTRRGGGAALVIALMALLLLLPMIYVLSIGPVLWFAEAYHLNCQWLTALQTIYMPLEWANGFPVLDRALDSYCNWWVPSDPPLL